MIQMFHVSKQFGHNSALVDINFRIRKGEFVFVTGPSGAGKTTLLRLIFGVERPSSGNILVNGIYLNRVKRQTLDLLRRDIGFVFQDFKLLPTKTVFQNVAIALEVTGARRSIIKKKTRQVLRQVGLHKKGDFFPLQLSGGEQQRVAIARAIVKNPTILLADEPTGNLDSDLTKDIFARFIKINEGGTTVIVATHNKEILNTYRRQIIFLDHGKIV